MCDETILRPSGSVTVIEDEERRLLRQGAPFVRKREVAPVSATAWDGLIIKPSAWCWSSGRGRVVFKVTTVTLSSSGSVVAEEKIYWVGYGDLNRDVKTRFTEFICSKITAPNRQLLGYIVLCIARQQNW